MWYKDVNGKKHVTNTPPKESSIYTVLQFSNSYQRENFQDNVLRYRTSQGNDMPWEVFYIFSI